MRLIVNLVFCTTKTPEPTQRFNLLCLCIFINATCKLQIIGTTGEIIKPFLLSLLDKILRNDLGNRQYFRLISAKRAEFNEEKGS